MVRVRPESRKVDHRLTTAVERAYCTRSRCVAHRQGAYYRSRRRDSFKNYLASVLRRVPLVRASRGGVVRLHGVCFSRPKWVSQSSVDHRRHRTLVEYFQIFLPHVCSVNHSFVRYEYFEDRRKDRSIVTTRYSNRTRFDGVWSWLSLIVFFAIATLTLIGNAVLNDILTHQSACYKFRIKCWHGTCWLLRRWCPV